MRLQRFSKNILNGHGQRLDIPSERVWCTIAGECQRVRGRQRRQRQAAEIGAFPRVEMAFLILNPLEAARQDQSGLRRILAHVIPQTPRKDVTVRVIGEYVDAILGISRLMIGIAAHQSDLAGEIILDTCTRGRCISGLVVDLQLIDEPQKRGLELDHRGRAKADCIRPEGALIIG